MTGTPYIRTIRFESREPIELSSDSILVLVGANNAGKTHFLKVLRSQLHGVVVDEVYPESGPFRDIELDWRGTPAAATRVVRERVQNTFHRADNGYTWNNGISYPGSSRIQDRTLADFTALTSHLGIYSDLFLEFDDAVERVNETELQEQRRPSAFHKKPSLTQLAYENAEASELIKSYFRQIFHEEISYYTRYGDVGYLLAPEPEDASPAGHAVSQATMDHMNNSPKLWLQGLGMRSVLGLLLKVFAVEKEIIIVDEPEAFLHPPQAAALGSILSEIAFSQNKQFILASHDRNLLNGLLKNPKHKVSIQRISRMKGESKVSGIDPATLSNVRNKSLIRYSTLFDSLFVRMTVLVENEKDAFFYSEAVDHILTKESENYPNISVHDILFISTSGKSGLPRTAELISSLGSKVIVACDLDLLVNRDEFLRTVEAVTTQKAPQRLIDIYERLVDVLFYKSPDEQARTKALKKSGGLGSSDTELKTIFDELLEELDELKVILHPLGELEDFCPKLKEPNGKAEWAQLAIQSNVHTFDPAVAFGKRILQHLRA